MATVFRPETNISLEGLRSEQLLNYQLNGWPRFDASPVPAHVCCVRHLHRRAGSGSLQQGGAQSHVMLFYGLSDASEWSIYGKATAFGGGQSFSMTFHHGDIHGTQNIWPPA
jgi:hypothetical protein